jgi:hypothetical protein
VNENNIILQGLFPGGRPHSSVLLNWRNDYSAQTEDRNRQIVINRHPNNLILQQKQNQRYNGQTHFTGLLNSIHTYPLDITRLNFNSPASSLPKNILQKMEKVFNVDFSGVKIHAEGREAESIGALAFTMGNNIYFASGRYAPYSAQGHRLLGYELAHVIQQKEGRVNNPQKEGMAVVYNPVLEAEAENIGILTERLLRQNKTIQRMKDESSSSSTVTIDHVTVIRGEFSTEVLEEVRKIIAAAHTAGGGPSAIQHPSMKMLKEFMANEVVKKPGSQGTFGVGGSGYFPTTLGMYTVGSQAFGSQMAAASESSESDVSVYPQFLGDRQSCVHAEVALMIDVPGVHSILTTQNACIFCYGLMASRGYTHQEIRKNPFPQKWTHDYKGFKLIKINPDKGWIKNVMKIDWNEESGYYTIEQ